MGKYLIVKDLEFSDFFKEKDGKIKTFSTLKEALLTCGMYELIDVLILKVERHYTDKR